MKMREILDLFETAARAPKKIPRQLFHGTLRSNLSTILSNGLEPRVGSYAQTWHGDKAPVGCVLAADRAHVANCLMAIFAQGNRGTFNLRDPEVFFEQGVLLVLPGQAFSHASHPGTHPGQVERNDFYAIEPVKPVRVLERQEFRQFAGQAFLSARRAWYGDDSTSWLNK